MEENFITSIFVDHSRNVKDLDIPLSDEYRQHLIFTGKNGSGKTSLLINIMGLLEAFISHPNPDLFFKTQQHTHIIQQLNNPNLNPEQRQKLERSLNDQSHFSRNGISIRFSNIRGIHHQKIAKGEFLFAFFDAKRYTSLNTPQGIKKIDLKKSLHFSEKANIDFIQYIVNLKAERSFARDDNELETINKIDEWFERFENRLKQIFDNDNLELRFNRKAYNFDIILGDNEPFNFTTLSDGYSAIISVVTELLMRMEAHNVKTYDMEGIVLIDEIETHLHVDLQKKILPFLTDFFPKIQFIITTHSPFVLSSLSNATICDLETKIVTRDLSGYSYDALIESYFKSDKYSDELKKKISYFELLTAKTEKTIDEKYRLEDLRKYLEHTPKYLSKGLLAKLQQIALNELNKTNN